MTLDPVQIRAQFPSLDRPAVFFDNPGGTQIARQSAGRIQKYLMECNANHEGAFKTSRDSDAMLDQAHQAMADMLNASRREEIVFGANMTTLTLSLSRALARTFNPGDEIVVTRLDHDANISPWLLAAEDRGCNITWVDFDVEDCTLKLDDFERALARKPKLVAFGYASNAVGTINPVHQITRMAHEAGALVYVDAVQYAPHGPIDVQDIGCDFLVCSAYKFFGPHAGILYGRYDLLDRLTAYKVRPAPALPPGKFETGTQNHEGIAGVLGAVEYLAWVGETFGGNGEAWREAGYRVRAGDAHLRHHRPEKAGPTRADGVLPAGGQTPARGRRSTGQRGLLRLGWQLLRAGGDRPAGDRDLGRHGAGRRGALQHRGRNRALRRGA
jgi:cysteine desulfurase family protein (TIGR01976 family)